MTVQCIGFSSFSSHTIRLRQVEAPIKQFIGAFALAIASKLRHKHDCCMDKWLKFLHRYNIEKNNKILFKCLKFVQHMMNIH